MLTIVAAGSRIFKHYQIKAFVVAMTWVTWGGGGGGGGGPFVAMLVPVTHVHVLASFSKV